ncbi:MAG: ArsB/NhaD family transporter [Anaerolineales bacterium]|nr:ArsB/NhaD family transporter [Anaerolineales bacterium]
MTPGLIATLIFVACLALIFTEKLNRTIVALAGSVLMVAVGMLMGFYSEEAAIHAIDFETLGLLFGMMVLVALLEPTGFVRYLAVWAGRFSKGRPLRLLVLLGVITTVLSMFLDNVTTVVLIAPVTVLISELLGVSPVPYLVAEAILSNTGGTATLVGDPPNVLISSAAGLSFNDFLTHSLPVIVLAWIGALLLLQFLFRKELRNKNMLNQAILSMDPKEALEQPKAARRVLIVLGGTVLLFLLQEPLHLTPSFIALMASAVGLVWIRPDLHDTLRRIEWSVLIFFGGLFVLVGGLEATGVLHQLAEILLHARNVPAPLFGVLLIWVVALLSAVVDNVPITIALIPVILDLELAGVNVSPLWWALAFGAGLGGNGTIIGSTANIVVASLSERTRSPITARSWSKVGIPVMLLTCGIVSLVYYLAYPLFTR